MEISVLLKNIVTSKIKIELMSINNNNFLLTSSNLFNL